MENNSYWNQGNNGLIIPNHILESAKQDAEKKNLIFLAEERLRYAQNKVGNCVETIVSYEKKKSTFSKKLLRNNRNGLQFGSLYTFELNEDNSVSWIDIDSCVFIGTSEQIEEFSLDQFDGNVRDSKYYIDAYFKFDSTFYICNEGGYDSSASADVELSNSSDLIMYYEFLMWNASNAAYIMNKFNANEALDKNWIKNNGNFIEYTQLNYNNNEKES